MFLTLPFALVGAIVAAFLTGGVLSLGSLVGLVTVIGISARNGIMLVSHYRHLELVEGVPFGRDLVVRGAEERLAPILMTALATGLALVPIVLGGSRAGYEIEHPLAVVILGGLGDLDAAQPVHRAGAVSEIRPARGCHRRDVDVTSRSSRKRRHEGRSAWAAALESSVPPWASAIHRAIGSPRPAPSGPAEADESLEHPIVVGGRDAGTVVRDPQHDLIAGPLQLGGDLPAGVGMTDGVVEQVAHHLAQQRVVGRHADLLGAAGDDAHAPLIRQHAHRTHAFATADRPGSGTRAATESRAPRRARAGTSRRPAATGGPPVRR